MIHIIVANRPIKISPSATAAMSLCLCRRDFCRNPPLLDASRAPGRS
jgi:hypothetical protein